MLSSQYNIQQNLQSGSAGIQIFEDINTSADQSVRVGEGAGKLSYGTGNAFVGYQAGEQNLAGSYDTFVGYQAGQLNQNSDSTTLVGAFAGRQNTSGNETVFVGFRAGEFNYNGNQNVGVGAYSLRENNSGSSVTAVGWRAAERNLDGDYNTMIGAEAGQNNRSGNYNTMAGYQVGRASFEGSENTFFGAYAGYSNEYGSDNCIIGFKAGLDVINGNFNIAIGAYSLSTGRVNVNTPSDCNVVIGAFTNTSGSGNVVLGLNAGSNSSGDDNVLIGKDVALVYSGRKSVIIGAEALPQGSGQCNVMLGYGIAPDFVNGSNNVFLGVGANVVNEDVSYSITIGTSNIKNYSHSIAIGNDIDNTRQESILVGFDINSDADNSVLVGKSLNIRNATVFKDPLNYPSISSVQTRADILFGTTTIDYSYMLNSPTNIIYPVAGAGQFTSNIVSSSGNPRKTTYTVPASYNLITANGAFDHSYIHYASTIIINEESEFNNVILANDMVRTYSCNFDVILINQENNINSSNNFYSNIIPLQLGYFNVSNAVTNLADFNTSNSTYNVYVQKQVQQPSYTYSSDTVFANNIASSTDTVGYSVTTDSDGNVYMTGLYTSPFPVKLQNLDKTAGDPNYDLPANTISSTGASVFIIKYDINGNVSGSTLIYGASPLYYRGSVCTDTNNKIYVAGDYTYGALEGINSTHTASTINLANTPNGQLTNGFVVQYNTDGTVAGAASIQSLLPTSAFRVHVDKSSNLYVSGFYISGIGNYNNISLSNLNGTISSKILRTTTYDSTNAFMIKYNPSGIIEATVSIIGNMPTNPTDLTGGAYGRSIHSDVYGNVYLAGDYRNVTEANILRNIDIANANSSYSLPITTNVTAYIIKYNSNGLVNGVITIPNTSPILNPYTQQLIYGFSDILDITSDSNGNIYITGTYLSSLPVQLYNMDGSEASYSLDPTYDGAIFIIKYDKDGNVATKTTIDGANAYTIQAGFSAYCDTSDNLFITGTYNTSVSITLKNLDATETQSTYTIPATLNACAFIISYNSLGKVTQAQVVDGPSFDASFSLTIDRFNTLYWSGTYLSTTPIYINNLNNLPGSTYLPATSPISSSAFIIKYKSSGNDITLLTQGPLDGAIYLSNISLNTTFINDGISLDNINTANTKVRYVIDTLPKYGVMSKYILNRTYQQSIQPNSTDLTKELIYSPIYEYAYIYSDINKTDSLTLFPYLQIYNNNKTSNLYGITNQNITSSIFEIKNSISSSNIIVRNSIIFNADNNKNKYTFTSNDFIGVPYGLNNDTNIEITSYDSDHFDLITPYNPFAYSNVRYGNVYIIQKEAITTSCNYNPIIGTLKDIKGDIPFTISVSSIPTNILDIYPSYYIPLAGGYGGSNSISTTYNLPNISIQNLWTLKASSNSDLQIAPSGITNLNQNTYRRLNPFIKNDTIQLVIQNNIYKQELNISFSNTSNYIYHTVNQSAVTNTPITTYKDTLDPVISVITLPITHTSNIYTNKYSSNPETGNTTLDEASSNIITDPLTQPYDNTSGYSNVYIYNLTSNIYPIDAQIVSSNALITTNYSEFTSNYVYSINKTLLGSSFDNPVPNITQYVSNIDNVTLSYTSNIIRTISNICFLTQAYDYTYENIDKIQNSFYNYGLINTYQSLLLYSSNTTSNQSASNVSITNISKSLVESGIDYYSNITSNISLQFHETHTSNAVLPITRAMMYNDYGSYEFQTACNFKVILSNQGVINNWTQSQIDNGSLYLQLTSNNNSEIITNTSNIIREKTTGSVFTNYYTLYNTNTIVTSTFNPSTYYLYDTDRYTYDGKSVRGIYNIKSLLEDLRDNINILGFSASSFKIVYINSNVDVLLLNQALVQTTTVNVSDNSYLVQTNPDKSLIELQLFATNVNESSITNILTVPVIINDIPPNGIPYQGFNYGISKDSKNIIDPAIFRHSWSNLTNDTLLFKIINTFTNANLRRNTTILNTNDTFTYQDCIDKKISVEPFGSNITDSLVYDLIDNTSAVLYPNLTYNIASYEYYAFPSTYELQTSLDNSLTTILYGSNQIANVFSDVFSSYIDHYTDRYNVAVDKKNLSIYIEKFPTRGVLYQSNQNNQNNQNIPYQCTLNNKIRYLSFTPDDIQHDKIDIRLAYRSSNISPKYSISLSNYAIPFLNIPIEAGAKSSNIPTQYFITSSSSNINRYLLDGNTFSSNYIPIPKSDAYPLKTYHYPITLTNKYGNTLATTIVSIEPYTLSAIPILTESAITLDVNQYSLSSLKSLLQIINPNYNWNHKVDFILTIPNVQGFSLSTKYGVIMKKSYTGTNGTLQLTPISHFTNEELLQDLIVYAHIGAGSDNPTALIDKFTCYATAGEYAYNTTLITVTLQIYSLPYIKSVADDYVYHNTRHSASNEINSLRSAIVIQLPPDVTSTDNVSLRVISTSNIDIVRTDTHNIIDVFSITDLQQGYIGYKIRSEFLNTTNFTEAWPFGLVFAPNGLSNVISSNELATIPQYSSMFSYNLKGTLNIYESSNSILYPPDNDQALSYAFSTSEPFGQNPIDILFQIKPSQSISTLDMIPTSDEYADSDFLRIFALNIKIGTTSSGSDILDAKLTETRLYIYGMNPMDHEHVDDTLKFDEWNNIIIRSIDNDDATKASITLNSMKIYLEEPLDTSNLKYISISVDETNTSNFTESIYTVNTENPYGGDIPLSYYISNYATTLYLRNFEIDVFTPFNSITNYDANTANVVIGKQIIVKGTDNIAIGKQFSTAGKNNIILGNYIGVDPNNLLLTNDVYESIVIGNDSFINSRIQDIIAIGNSNLNGLANIDPDKVNQFISEKPIIIGNNITSDYIDYHINLANTFLRTNVGNSQVYLGLNQEKVAIGYTANESFSRYQDLYVAHGIAIGTNPSTSTQQFALDVVGDMNITGNIYKNNTALYNTWLFTLNKYNSNITPDVYINQVSAAVSTASTGFIYFNSITSDGNGNLYRVGSYNCGVPFNVTLYNLDESQSELSLPATYYGFTNLGTTCLLKYDVDGKINAFSIIDNQFYDSGKSVCVDNAGNIYITGYYQTAYFQDFILNNIDTIGTTNNTSNYKLDNNVNIGSYIVKYNSSGEVQGSASINSYFSSNIGNVICTDGSSIYAMGDYNSFYLDPITFQPPNPYAPIPLPISLSNLDGAISLYQWLPGTNYQHDGYIIKYDTNGVIQASTTLIGSGQMPNPADPTSNIGLGTASILAGCTDQTGNLYVGGTYQGYTYIPLSNIDFPNTASIYQLPLTFGLFTGPYIPPNTYVPIPSSFLVKYDVNGAVQGSTSIFSQITTTNTDDNRILGIHTDNTCNVYVTGIYTASGGYPIGLFNLNGTPTYHILPATYVPSGFIVKYDTSGNVVGTTSINGTNTSKGVSICSDSKGNIFASGLYQSTNIVSLTNLNGTLQTDYKLPSTTVPNTYIIKYNSNGIIVNATNINTGLPIIENTKYDNAHQLYCYKDIYNSNAILDNIYLTGTYNVNQTINLYNLDNGNTINSLTLPPYSGTKNAAYFIRYNNVRYISPDYDYNIPTIYVNSGSNVGIGTSFVPYNTQLYVQGNEFVSETLTASNINFTGGLFENGQPYIGSQWTTAGTDIYYSGGSVGIQKVPNNIYSLDVLGNINFTGNIYQNGILYPLGGTGAYGDGSNASNIWVRSCNIASVIVPGAGSISYSSSSNSIFRHCDNDIEYAFDLTFTITAGSGGIGDYKLEVPFEVDTSYYLNNSIIGSAWSYIIKGSLSNYFPISIRSPVGTHQSNVIVRFINGTTETSLSSLPSGTTVQLAGMVNYVSTSILPTIGLGGGNGTIWQQTYYGIYNSNNTNVGIGTSAPQYTLDVNGNINFASNLYQRNVLIDLTQINIATSNINKVNPWIITPTSPQLIIPSPGILTYSFSNSLYRYVDNDVEYVFNINAVVTQASGSGDYKISLPVPFNSNYYVPNTIIGNAWSRIITGGLSNYIPISVSTISASDSNHLNVRFVNGTSETPLSILTAGTNIQLSGAIEYIAPLYQRSGIFLSNVCYQDDYGHIGFNTFGPLKGQVDIISNEIGRPALYVEHQNNEPMALFIGSGNIGIGTATPQAKLDIEGSIIVSSSIGIGITNTTYQLELSLDSATKPTTNTWTVSSDMRVKEDIENADLDRCYDVLKELRLCRFKWNSNYLPHVTDKHMLGWIAQEVEPLIPNAITKTSKYGFPDMCGLDSDQIIKFMYGAIQKNIQQIEEQNKMIKQQQVIIDTLRKDITEIKEFLIVNTKFNQ